MTTTSEKVAAAIFSGSAITALVSTRYWPDIAPEGATLPYITYQVISEIRNDHLKGPGVGKRSRAQINCHAATRKGADALADAVEKHFSTLGRILYRQGTYDVEAQVYWCQLDWSVVVASP
jgi:hypothetical protein